MTYGGHPSPSELTEQLRSARVQRTRRPRGDDGFRALTAAMLARTDALAASVNDTLTNAAQRTPGAGASSLERITRLFLQWMRDGTTVRVIGAGRARMAASMPANRLAHGGARVYVQNDIIPMPHTVQAGAIIAASASGKTESVLKILRTVSRSAPHIVTVGIADHRATEFSDLCHHFIGIREVAASEDTLRALADFGEHIISQVLDSVIVAAGRLGGFDDRRWRLGHENIGDTGPYDAESHELDTLFHELW